MAMMENIIVDYYTIVVIKNVILKIVMKNVLYYILMKV